MGIVGEIDEHGTSNFQGAAKEKDQRGGRGAKHAFLRNEPDFSSSNFRCNTICKWKLRQKFAKSESGSFGGNEARGGVATVMSLLRSSGNGGCRNLDRNVASTRREWGWGYRSTPKRIRGGLPKWTGGRAADGAFTVWR